MYRLYLSIAVWLANECIASHKLWASHPFHHLQSLKISGPVGWRERHAVPHQFRVSLACQLRWTQRGLLFVFHVPSDSENIIKGGSLRGILVSATAFFLSQHEVQLWDRIGTGFRTVTRVIHMATAWKCEVSSPSSFSIDSHQYECSIRSEKFPAHCCPPDPDAQPDLPSVQMATQEASNVDIDLNNVQGDILYVSDPSPRTTTTPICFANSPYF